MAKRWKVEFLSKRMVNVVDFKFLRHLYILVVDIIICYVSDVANLWGHNIKLSWVLRIHEENTR